jgi:glycolate oxidase iron-sulfur subunit
MPDRNKLPILKTHENSISRCFRCGLCRSVCPSFNETQVESASPRGRVQFAEALLENRISLNGVFQDRMLDCLNCMKCSEICPSGVRTDRIVLAARAELASRGKMNPLKKLLFNTVLKNHWVLDYCAKLAGLGQRWFYNDNFLLEALVPKISGMGDKKFPALAVKSALSKWPVVIPANGDKILRVGYFVGCATNLLFPEVADATIRVLAKNNVEVVLPRGQVCCGIPVYSSGDFKNAKKLAEHNLGVFRNLDIDCIITDCASCSAALKQEVHDLLGVDNFGVPVYDLNEFLINKIKMKKTFSELHLKVTYHDPCHLKRGQDIYREPRELIKMVPGIEFIEMDGADNCCGGAGTFSFTHHDLSRKVGKGKVENIRRTGAGFVSTPCPSCKMHIDDLLHHEGIFCRTVHPVQILDMAYRKGEEEIRSNNDRTKVNKYEIMPDKQANQVIGG